jgi:Uma2 family endonuclease
MALEREATVDDLRRVPGHAKAEIVGGRLVVMTPTGGRHSYAVGEIFASLRDYARRTGCGTAFPDNAGFIVTLPNRRSFSPDVALWTGGFITADFLEGAPLVAVEVRSPEEYGPVAERAIAAKIEDYFAAGTSVVWDVDVLRAGEVVVHRADSPTRSTTYGRGELADAEPTLPGWRMPVSDLFPPG